MPNAFLEKMHIKIIFNQFNLLKQKNFDLQIKYNPVTIMNGDKQIRRYTDENSYLKMKCIFNFYISFAVSVCLLVCF